MLKQIREWVKTLTLSPGRKPGAGRGRRKKGKKIYPGALPPEMQRSALANDHKKQGIAPPSRRDPGLHSNLPDKDPRKERGARNPGGMGSPPENSRRKPAWTPYRGQVETWLGQGLVGAGLVLLSVFILGLLYPGLSKKKSSPERGQVSLALKSTSTSSPMETPRLQGARSPKAPKRSYLQNQNLQDRSFRARRVFYHRQETQNRIQQRALEAKIKNYYNTPPLKEEDLVLGQGGTGLAVEPSWPESRDLQQRENEATKNLASSQQAPLVDPEVIIVQRMKIREKLYHLDQEEQQNYLHQFRENARAGGWLVDATIEDGQLVVNSYRPLR